MQIYKGLFLKYFSGLDYNPYATSNFSTYKWHMVSPIQFIINNYTQTFWWSYFGNNLTINI